MHIPGVCVKAADGAALTGRGANGRNPMALWGERGPLLIIIIIITNASAQLQYNHYKTVH
jgi:hypothetical protein